MNATETRRTIHTAQAHTSQEVFRQADHQHIHFIIRPRSILTHYLFFIIIYWLLSFRCVRAGIQMCARWITADYKIV